MVMARRKGATTAGKANDDMFWSSEIAKYMTERQVQGVCCWIGARATVDSLSAPFGWAFHSEGSIVGSILKLQR